MTTPTTTQTQLECQRIQQDEFDILSYIYLDEFHITKEHTPYKFSILVRPYLPKHQHEYQISLHFEYTKTYPKTPIKYDIEPLAGITRDNLNAITKKIEDLIYENRDKPIVYDVVEEIRLWIVDFLVEGRAYETYFEVEKKAQEFFERPKFAAFTPVTVENFLNWKKEFQLKHKKAVTKKQTEIKLTGKQWFMGKKDEEIQESEEEESDQEDQEEEKDDEQKNFDQPENKLFMMDEEQTVEVEPTN